MTMDLVMLQSGTKDLFTQQLRKFVVSFWDFIRFLEGLYNSIVYKV